MCSVVCVLLVTDTCHPPYPSCNAGREVECEGVDSQEGPLQVDIVEQGCTQHSASYPGGMVLLTILK